MPWVWLEYYEHVFKALSQFFENIWLGLRIWIADIPIWALNSQGRLICSICAHPSIPTRGASSWQGTRAAGGDWQLGHQLVYESRNKIKNIIIDWCFGMMLNNANLKTTIHLKEKPPIVNCQFFFMEFSFYFSLKFPPHNLIESIWFLRNPP